MKPLTTIASDFSIDAEGNLYYTNAEGETSSLDDLTIASEKSREKQVNILFDDAVLNDGDMIYIRKHNGAIQWLKANVMGVGTKGENWKELSPETRKRLNRDSGASTVEESLPTEAKEEMAIQEPEQFENGWYQDDKGNLHKYEDGKWSAGAPSIDKLEYLG